MFFKKSIVYFLSKKNKLSVENWSKKSIINQQKIFNRHVNILPKTLFGKNIKSHSNMSLLEFREAVSINSYENPSYK